MLTFLDLVDRVVEVLLEAHRVLLGEAQVRLEGCLLGLIVPLEVLEPRLLLTCATLQGLTLALQLLLMPGAGNSQIFGDNSMNQ